MHLSPQHSFQNGGRSICSGTELVTVTILKCEMKNQKMDDLLFVQKIVEFSILFVRIAKSTF